MSDNRTVFKENEIEANKVAANIMSIAFFVYSIVFVLNLVGFFAVPMTIMIVAYIFGSIALLIPVIMVKKYKNYREYMKHIFLFSSCIFILITTSLLSYHMVVFFVFPMIVACLYFNKRYTDVAITLTVICTIIAQLINHVTRYVDDWNHYNMKTLVMFAIIPRTLGVITLGWLLKKVVERAYVILGDLMNAEEQKELVEKNENIKNKAIKVSDILLNSVEELEGTTATVSGINNVIVNEAGDIREKTAQNKETIKVIGDRFTEIVENINDLDHDTEGISNLTKDVSVKINSNTSIIGLATNNMIEINKSSDKCKEQIEILEDKSKEIINIVRMIADISEQTQLLSLNASIEAARAGEQGKGFAVVAEEIGKLANQTNDALSSIEKIIGDVVYNTNEAVTAIEYSGRTSREGLDNIIKAEKISKDIMLSQEEMASGVEHVYKVAKIIVDNSREIEQYLESINDLIKGNYEMVGNISKVTDDSSESMKTLVNMVDTIKGVTNELSLIVNS